MAIEVINLGTLALDGKDGDKDRDAHMKVNRNFTDANNAASRTVGGDEDQVPLVSNVREIIGYSPPWSLPISVGGGLTPLAEKAIRDKLKLNIFNDVPLLFALADANGYLTDLQVDDEGKIPNRVLEQWNARLKAMNGGDVVVPPVTPTPTTPSNTPKLNLVHTLPVLTTTLTSLHQADSHYRNGELLPVMPDRNKVILIGSSSIEKSRTLITNELKTLNASVQVLNVGYSGATIEQQEVSVGNNPMRIRVTSGNISKSGDTLLVNVDNYKTSAYTSSITGWINGVLGKLKISGSNLYFTRTGTAATDTDATGDLYFIPDKGNEYRNAIQILWVGKNNLTNTDPAVNNVMQLLDKTDRMIENSASLIKRVVVMTHWNDTDVPAISAERDRVNQCNHLYKLRYKENVFDVESYILGSQIFTDLGITRTQADINAQSIGNLPPSLAADRVHATSAVYAYLASKLKEFINNKKYLEV